MLVEGIVGMHTPRLRMLITSLSLVICGFLASCGALSGGVLATTKAAFQFGSAPADTASLNPSVRYLRVMIDGRVALLVLGYTDFDRLGPVEVWYSADRTVLRLQNGHVVGLTGTNTEWRQARLSAMPQWPTATAASEPTIYTRMRDVMPGYRFGVQDSLSLRAISPPAKSNLAVLKATDLRWFEAVEKNAKLPAARFALTGSDQGNFVVYSEQCISSALCLSWQQWPAVLQP